MQQEIQQTPRRVSQQVPDQGVAASDTYLLRVGPQLWRAVVREDLAPAEDTRAALRAIRTALDAVRRLRLAGGVTEDERRRLAALAAEAVEEQERALRLWSVGRRLDTALGIRDGNFHCSVGGLLPEL